MLPGTRGILASACASGSHPPLRQKCRSCQRGLCRNWAGRRVPEPRGPPGTPPPPPRLRSGPGWAVCCQLPGGGWWEEGRADGQTDGQGHGSSASTEAPQAPTPAQLLPEAGGAAGSCAVMATLGAPAQLAQLGRGRRREGTARRAAARNSPPRCARIGRGGARWWRRGRAWQRRLVARPRSGPRLLTLFSPKVSNLNGSSPASARSHRHPDQVPGAIKCSSRRLCAQPRLLELHAKTGSVL